MNLKSVLVLALLAVFTGCATARLPESPDIFSLQQFSTSTRIAVPKVVDERGTNNAGTIGAAGIKVKDEIVDFTTNHLLHALNTRLNVNVVTTGPVNEAQASQAVETSNTNGLVIAKIKRLKMHSIDALMQPVEVDMDMDVLVYDKQGQKLIEKTIIGHYEKRIGLGIVDKSTGELVDATVKETMQNLVKDTDFKNAIQKLALK